jgi:L-lactate dehydrogenase complex protein LldG
MGTAIGDAKEKFQQVLESIGGRVVEVIDANIAERLLELFPSAKRIVSSITTVERYFLKEHRELVHHSLADVDVAIIESKLGVAENGAIWVTEEDLKIRVLPFIPEHLVVVLKKELIVPTMHQAYEKIDAEAGYGFGVFIAGPSKTADIEQSLVLGAHGPKSMTIFLLNC